MSCSYDRDLILDLIDGQLSDEDRRAVSLHLEGCRECTAYLSDHLGVRRAMQSLPRQRCPVDIRVRIAALRAADEKAPGFPHASVLFSFAWRAGAVAAALALVLLGAWGVQRSTNTVERSYVADNSVSDGGAMSSKVGSYATDILDPSFTGELAARSGNVTVKIAPKVDPGQCVIMSLREMGSDTGTLRTILKDLNLSASFLGANPHPTYSIKDVSPESFSRFVISLKAAFGEVSVGNKLQEFSESRKSELRDIVFMVKLPVR
ncbi:MAG: anti-sigma factor [Candidatus Brocadiia bacterium]